jgi:hypothetical protein
VGRLVDVTVDERHVEFGGVSHGQTYPLDGEN